MNRRRTAIAATAALVALGAPVLGAPAPARADFDVVAQWSDSEPVTEAGTTVPKAANLEALPDGRLIAVLLANGDDHGHPGDAVVVSRIRDTAGTWSVAQVTSTGAPWTGTGAPEGRTFDTFADSSGRVLAVWAVKSATSGQWPVMSVSRDPAGAWSTPEQVYLARTDGAYSDSLEISFIIPRLVPVGDTVTVAWSTTTAVTNGSIDTSTDPFRARRWTSGVWGPEVVSDGYGAEGPDVAPLVPDSTRVKADPARAVRASDGRISFVYTLVKHRTVRTVAHPMNPGGAVPGEVNVADVWDGAPEPRNAAHTETAWVVHLDPASAGWGPPMKLVRSGGVPTVCTTDLPNNPPLAAHWAEWKADSAAGELSTGCGYGEESTRPSASYAPDGDLRITLDHRSGPSSDIVLNQFLDKACDDPSATDSSRFCFDDWGPTDWAVTWNDASLRIEAGTDRPGLDAIQQTTPAPDPEEFVAATSAGVVRVVEASGTGGKAILFDRASGTDVTWTPDPGNATADKVNVTHVFASGGDVAAFFTYGSVASGDGCGLAVLRAGQTTVDRFSGCVSGTTAQSAQRDVVQLSDGRLARIDASMVPAPVWLFAVTDGPLPPAAVPVITSPAASTTTSHATALTSHTVRWSDVGATSYDVRYRRAPWNGSFGAHTLPAAWQGRIDTSLNHSLTRGYTYCYSARATDLSDRTSAWGTERCTIAPLDQTSTKRSSGWTTNKSAGYFTGSAWSTKTKNATLTRTSARLKRVGVLATTCPTCGVIDVYVGSTKIGRISLARGTSTVNKKPILLPVFSLRSGTVKIKVVTSGRTVRIDGVFIGAR